jgi:hypothetical protein
MAMVKFTYYLHDDYQSNERDEFISDSTGLSLEKVEDLEIGEPFNEIGLRCLLDTETGNVIILGVDQ